MSRRPAERRTQHAVMATASEWARIRELAADADMDLSRYIVNGGGIMLHARRPGGPVAAAQKCATHGPLSVATRGGGCTAWSSMRRFDWRLSTRV